MIDDKNFDKEIKHSIKQIETKIRNGEDLNPHLSTTIKAGNFTDRLLADWNIYHLHLSLEGDPREREFVKGTTFTKRTRNVLFLMVSNETIYLIDIRPHGPSGEKYVFAKKDLLITVADNWPEILEPFRMKGVTGIEFETDDPKQIEEFRKLGIDIPYRINDGFYSSPGGLTMNSRSVQVEIDTDSLIEMAELSMRCVTDGRSKIDEKLSLTENYDPVRATFRLKLLEGAFIIYEESTQSILSFVR